MIFLDCFKMQARQAGPGCARLAAPGSSRDGLGGAFGGGCSPGGSPRGEARCLLEETR